MPFSIRPFRRFVVQCRYLQRWSNPRTRPDLESLLYRLASLWGPTHATRGHALADRHAAE